MEPVDVHPPDLLQLESPNPHQLPAGLLRKAGHILFDLPEQEFRRPVEAGLGRVQIQLAVIECKLIFIAACHCAAEQGGNHQIPERLFFPALLLLSHRLNQPGHPAGQPAQNLLLLFCKRCQCEAGRILTARGQIGLRGLPQQFLPVHFFLLVHADLGAFKDDLVLQECLRLPLQQLD